MRVDIISALPVLGHLPEKLASSSLPAIAVLISVTFSPSQNDTILVVKFVRSPATKSLMTSLFLCNKKKQ